MKLKEYAEAKLTGNWASNKKLRKAWNKPKTTVGAVCGGCNHPRASHYNSLKTDLNGCYDCIGSGREQCRVGREGIK
jgi:hypothetical protein